MGLKARTKKAGNGGAKTLPTTVPPRTFVAGLGDERREAECRAMIAMMSELSGEKPIMWGPSLIGFGTYHFKYASGREGDWPRTAFSPRKSGLVIYCMPGFREQIDLLSKLGPHTKSVSCLNIRRLENVDQAVLRQIIKRSLDQMRKLYPPSGA